jgi:hypothetical protein
MFFFFLRARSTTPLKYFYGRFRALVQWRPFPDLHCNIAQDENP